MKHYAVVGRVPDQENHTITRQAEDREDAIEQFEKFMRHQLENDELEAVMRAYGRHPFIIEAVLSSESPIEIE